MKKRERDTGAASQRRAFGAAAAAAGLTPTSEFTVGCVKFCGR